MSLARAKAGGVLRRLAGGPEARRCTSSLQTAHALQTPSPPPLSTMTASLSASASSSSSPSFSRSSPFFVCASRFHTSAPRPARRRRRFNNVPAAAMGLVDDASIAKFSEEHFPGYTEDEKAVLRQKYTPAQIAALEAGEAAIDTRDLTIQGRMRTDARVAGINYVDDFSQVQPVIDKRARDPAAAANVAVDVRPMDEDTFADDLEAWLKSFVPKDVSFEGLSLKERVALAEEHGPLDLDALKYFYERPSLVHRDGKTRVTLAETGNSSLAPALPREVPGVSDASSRTAQWVDPDDEGLDEAGNYTDLVQRTGLKVSEINHFATRVLVVRSVSNQTRLGKMRSFSVLAIAGNGNGRLGLGSFKSTEQVTAQSKAKEMAVRNMRPIPRYENRTIYGNVECKISGTVVQLFARPPGFGLRVPHRIFEIARAAGIQDLAAKIPRSRNPMNTVKATFEALMKQRDPEEIATGRGKKLVDVRKVYYGGAVY